jgi:hypothetical protein
MPSKKRPEEALRSDIAPEAANDTRSDDGDDTEGHSLLTYELGRTVANERSREAGDWARNERLRKDAKANKKR